MVDLDKLIYVRLQLGFDYAISNTCSSIWVFWDASLDYRIIFNSNQCISVQCKHCMVENTLLISAIYGKCNKIERRELWLKLEMLALTEAAWLI